MSKKPILRNCESGICHFCGHSVLPAHHVIHSGVGARLQICEDCEHQLLEELLSVHPESHVDEKSVFGV